MSKEEAAEDRVETSNIREDTLLYFLVFMYD